jgi:hypothetical protein
VHNWSSRDPFFPLLCLRFARPLCEPRAPYLFISLRTFLVFSHSVIPSLLLVSFASSEMIHNVAGPKARHKPKDLASDAHKRTRRAPWPFLPGIIYKKLTPYTRAVHQVRLTCVGCFYLLSFLFSFFYICSFVISLLRFPSLFCFVSF